MIHTKNLQFSYNDIDFEAIVTFNNISFKNVGRSDTSIFYDVKLIKPEILECGGKVFQISGMSLMLFSGQMGDRHYIYKEDSDLENDGDNINVYPKAIVKILYCYFNKEQIAYYRKKIVTLNEAVEKKYATALNGLQEEKLALRKQLKSEEIDSKTYQQRYKPIRLKKEEIAFKISGIKYNYKRRYFECCELKPCYRTFLPQDVVKCKDTDLYTFCGMTRYMAKQSKNA